MFLGPTFHVRLCEGSPPPSRRSSRRTIMPVGTVKWFNPKKRFGFIEPDDGSADVFVHLSAAEEDALVTLDLGKKVSFALQPTPQGKVAAVNFKAESPRLKHQWATKLVTARTKNFNR